MEIILSDHYTVSSAGMQYVLYKDGEMVASGPRRRIMEVLTEEGPVLPPAKFAQIEALPEVPGF